MRFVSSAAIIPVDLHVTRYRVDPEAGLVEVWGHVGDYEICVFLPPAEARRRGLPIAGGPGPEVQTRKTKRR